MQYNPGSMDLLNTPIILASGSPRRLEILRAHGIEPEVIVSAVDEQRLVASLPPELAPAELVQLLALHKAQAVFEQLSSDSPHAAHDAIILAADTLVYSVEVGILGKPANRADAVRMLQALCNTTHEAITGMAVIELATGIQRSLAEVTTVHFGEYGLQDIEEYLATEPPYDKAGSYAIQGMWNRHVTAVEGDLENVIGLPFYRLDELLVF